MPRGGKPKYKNFSSENFEVIFATTQWRVMCHQSLSVTKWFYDLAEYRRLKKLWRKSKTKFDAECRNMEFLNLFNYKEMDSDMAEQKKEQKLERIVDVLPSFDERSRGCGIGACRIRFILKGSKGAVQFMIGTDWYTKSAREHLDTFPPNKLLDMRRVPQGWDVGYHSPKPMYEGQTSMGTGCELVDGECYYDGSSMRADSWVEDFVAGGTDWLWPKLEEEYMRLFETEEPKTGEAA